mgnify:CR=1 FL=1
MAQKKTKTKSFNTKFISFLWKSFASLVVLTLLFLSSIKIGLWGKLPETTELENPKTKLASEIYANNGDILGKIFYQGQTVNSKTSQII